MSLLQFLIIIASVVFLLFGIDRYKRKKATLLHFLVFIGGSLSLILFSIRPDYLDKFGSYFWLARGADLLVYIAIILLFYFYIEIINHTTKDKFQLTKLISQLAVQKTIQTHNDEITTYSNKTSKDNYVFLIRVYNEASVLASTIDTVINNWFKKIIFVNDGSKDNSLDIITEKKKQYKDSLMITLSNTINRGPGAANQTWYAFLKEHGHLLNIERVVWYDADGQMDINDMNTFMDNIEQDAHTQNKPEMYLGSRFLQGSKVENMPPVRRVILYVSRIVTRLFYRVQITDPHIGYRVMSLKTLNKITITSDWFHYANEFNEQIHKNKIRFKEVPVHIIYNEYTLWKGQKSSNSILLGLEMIYKKFFFR